jgi:hypothetical protein
MQIARADALRVLEGNPRAMYFMFERLATTIRELSGMLEGIVFLDAAVRLARYLVELERLDGVPLENWVSDHAAQQYRLPDKVGRSALFREPEPSNLGTRAHPRNRFRRGSGRPVATKRTASRATPQAAASVPTTRKAATLTCKFIVRPPLGIDTPTGSTWFTPPVSAPWQPNFPASTRWKHGRCLTVLERHLAVSH